VDAIARQDNATKRRASRLTPASGEQNGMTTANQGDN